MKLPVRGEPHPVAGRTIWLADWADKSDHPARAFEAEVSRLVGEIFRRDLSQAAERRFDSPPRLDIRHIALHRERRAFTAAERHQLDKSHVPIALESQPRHLDN